MSGLTDLFFFHGSIFYTMVGSWDLKQSCFLLSPELSWFRSLCTQLGAAEQFSPAHLQSPEVKKVSQFQSDGGNESYHRH